jgi:hypothetical protein
MINVIYFMKPTFVPAKYGKCRKFPVAIFADGLSEMKLPGGPTAGSQSWLFKVDEIISFVMFINFFPMRHGMSVSNQWIMTWFTSNGTCCKHGKESGPVGQPVAETRAAYGFPGSSN